MTSLAIPNSGLPSRGGRPFADVEDAVEIAPPTRIGGIIRFALALAVLFFGVMGGWAAVTPLTSAAIAPGRFMVDGDSLTIQHLEGGIVREILVSEGAKVEKGDVLLRLDDTQARARIGILRDQLAGAMVTDARLAAEEQGADRLVIGPKLRAAIGEDAELEAIVAAEQRVFVSNRSMEDGQSSILTERVLQLKEEIGGLQADDAALGQQLELIRQELADAEQLFDKGLMSKPRVLALRRAEAGIRGDRGRLAGSLSRARQQIGEIEQRRLQIRRDRLKAIASERQALRDRIFDLRQRLAAAQDVLDRLVVRAPWAGSVVDLKVNTLGAVVRPGEPLMQIVPSGTELVVSAQLRPSDVDSVRPGLPARVRLTAYSYRTTPPVAAEVENVSADRLVDELTGQPYFRVDLRIDPDSLAHLQDARPVPGMGADVMIETGERTILDYFLSPLLTTFDSAMRES